MFFNCDLKYVWTFFVNSMKINDLRIKISRHALHMHATIQIYKNGKACWLRIMKAKRTSILKFCLHLLPMGKLNETEVEAEEDNESMKHINLLWQVLFRLRSNRA